MELKSKVQELEMLEIEIPALVETKEGKLLGGFCTIATTGFDVLQCRMVVKLVVRIVVMIVARLVLVRAIASINVRILAKLSVM